MVLTNFDGTGVGFGFGVGCGFGIGWGFGGCLIKRALCLITSKEKNKIIQIKNPTKIVGGGDDLTKRPQPRGIQCRECKGFGHIQAECANTLKRNAQTTIVGELCKLCLLEGMPLNILGLGAGGGCGVGLGLGWGFGTAFGCQYRSSRVTFQGIDFNNRNTLSKESPKLRAAQQ